MITLCKKFWEKLCVPKFGLYSSTRVSCWKSGSMNNSMPSEEMDEAFLYKSGLQLFDADFFSDEKVLEMAKGAKEYNIPAFRANRKLVASENGGLYNPSVLVFNSEWGMHESPPHKNKKFSLPDVSSVQKPDKEEDIAFMGVFELGYLIRTKQITSQKLTEIFLERLKRYNHCLEAVVTYTEDLAYQQSKEADRLIDQGVYLGPLHGIPYGLKDIISVPHYKTTWGSKTFQNQVLVIEAWVYKRLKSAGAVLVAKLAPGSLGYDDIWFGGRTRNPWNIEEFSTGSSAGPAACTSAGGLASGQVSDMASSTIGIRLRTSCPLRSQLSRMAAYIMHTSNPTLAGYLRMGLVPFAIGSETAGSITYPAARCGVTALRPTFGTVGRTGVMSISESLDKLGPICRNALDCAIILDVIRGKDPNDLSSRDISLEDPFSVDTTKLTVGYLEDAEMEVVDVLASKGMGINMVPFKLNYMVNSVQHILTVIMGVDMLSHFDDWQRSGQDDVYEAQEQWPPELRRARIIPAVDYIQAQRARGRLVREVRNSFTVDAFVGHIYDWEKICMGNLVGMPVTVIPTGLMDITNPPPGGTRRRTTKATGIYAPPQHDHVALALAMAYQSVTNHHKERPPIDDLGPDDVIPNHPTADRRWHG